MDDKIGIYICIYKTIFEIDAAVFCYVSADVALKFWHISIRYANIAYR